MCGVVEKEGELGRRKRRAEAGRCGSAWGPASDLSDSVSRAPPRGPDSAPRSSEFLWWIMGRGWVFQEVCTGHVMREAGSTSACALGGAAEQLADSPTCAGSRGRRFARVRRRLRTRRMCIRYFSDGIARLWGSCESVSGARNVISQRRAYRRAGRLQSPSLAATITLIP